MIELLVVGAIAGWISTLGKDKNATESTSRNNCEDYPRVDSSDYDGYSDNNWSSSSRSERQSTLNEW